MSHELPGSGSECAISRRLRLGCSNETLGTLLHPGGEVAQPIGYVAGTSLRKPERFGCQDFAAGIVHAATLLDSGAD